MTGQIVREGPRVRLTLSCFGCIHETSQSDACQGDSGHNVFCTAGGGRRSIGYSNWDTPEWCPYRDAAVSALKEQVK